MVKWTSKGHWLRKMVTPRPFRHSVLIQVTNCMKNILKTTSTVVMILIFPRLFKMNLLQSVEIQSLKLLWRKKRNQIISVFQRKKLLTHHIASNFVSAFAMLAKRKSYKLKEEFLQFHEAPGLMGASIGQQIQDVLAAHNLDITFLVGQGLWQGIGHVWPFKWHPSLRAWKSTLHK